MGITRNSLQIILHLLILYKLTIGEEFIFKCALFIKDSNASYSKLLLFSDSQDSVSELSESPKAWIDKNMFSIGCSVVEMSYMQSLLDKS